MHGEPGASSQQRLEAARLSLDSQIPRFRKSTVWLSVADAVTLNAATNSVLISLVRTAVCTDACLARSTVARSLCCAGGG